MKTSNLRVSLINDLKTLQKQPERWEIVTRSTPIEVGTDYEMRYWAISTGMTTGPEMNKLPIRVRAILHEHSSPVYMADNIITEIEQRIREARDENA